MTLLKTACLHMVLAQRQLQTLAMHINVRRRNPEALRLIAQAAEAPAMDYRVAAYALSTIPAANESHMEVQQ